MPLAPDRLRRVCAASGIFPLALWLPYHLWETYGAFRGPRAFADRISGPGSPTATLLEIALVLVPLSVHAAAGLAIWWRQRGEDPGSYPTIGSRRLARVSGAVALVFVLGHLAIGWVPRIRGDLTGLDLYAHLDQVLGVPAVLGLHVLGITAVCLHLADGVPAFARTFALTTSGAGHRRLTVLSYVASVVIWAFAIHTTAHFAAGRGIFWQAPPDAPADAPAGGTG